MATDLAKAFKSLPYFDNSQGKPYRHHRRALCQWYTVNNITSVGEKKLALISSLRGLAGEKASPLGINTARWNELTEYDAYELAIKELFEPKVESSLARSEFKLRKQGRREDVGSYFSAKYALFMVAYADTPEFHIFFSELIAGIYSQVIKKLLRREIVTNIEELRQALYRVVANERISYLEGYGDSTSLDGLAAVTSGTDTGLHRQQDEDDRMDIGQLGPRKGQKETRRCNSCKKVGHIAKNCRSAKGKTDKTHTKSSSSANNSNKRCFWCQKSGHLQSACYAKRNGKPRVQAPQVTQIEAAEAGQLEELDEDKLVEQLQRMNRINQLTSGNESGLW